MALTREQFERLALEQLDAVDRVALSLTRERSAADDLVQETFLHAIKAWQSFTLHEFGIKPWLLRILHNLFVNRVKREKRQPAAIEQEALQSVETEAKSAEWASADYRDWDGPLKNALERLPADLRTILLLWAVDELSYKELAQVLDIPIGTVMSRLHRARQQLHGRLEGVARDRGMVQD